MLKNTLRKTAQFIFAASLFISFVQTAQAASLFIFPASGSFHTTIKATVFVSSPNESVNSFSATITFPKDKLNAVSISKDGSVANFFPKEPAFSNQNGTVTFEGVNLGSGFQGTTGKLIEITFTVKSLGAAALAFSESQILANDGSGTDVTKPGVGASYTLAVAPKPVVNTPVSVPKTETAEDKSDFVQELGPAVPADIKPIPTSSEIFKSFIWNGVLAVFLLAIVFVPGMMAEKFLTLPVTKVFIYGGSFFILGIILGSILSDALSWWKLAFGIPAILGIGYFWSAFRNKPAVSVPALPSSEKAPESILPVVAPTASPSEPVLTQSPESVKNELPVMPDNSSANPIAAPTEPKPPVF